MVKPWFSSWRGAIIDNRGKPSDEYVSSALKLPDVFDGDRAVRAFIGWDGVAIFDKGVDVARLACEYALQYQNYAQACGRCMPGRAGGRILYDLLDKIARGEGENEDIERLRTACLVMQSSSKCEIGRTTPKAILQLIEYFPQAFNERVILREKSAEYDSALPIVAKVTAPCSDACPDRVDIPAYIEALKDRRPLKSVEETRKAMPLAHVCARVCPHPCEDSCRRSHFDESVSIMELKRIGADYEDKRALSDRVAIKRAPIGKKVAIVGAGPAGLTAGYYLGLNGVECDIFEALPVAGGEVMTGVPEYRMPSAKYLSDIRFATSCGAKIHLNSPIDVEKLIELEKNYDAILLSFGARVSKKLRCENENESVKGYWGAISFLDRINLWEKFRIGSPVDLTGKTVVCAGGGFTSMDVVRCAVRAGAKRVIMLYRRSERVIIRNTSEEEYKEALEEGVEFIFRAAIARIIDENGAIKKVVCNRYEAIEGGAGGSRQQLVKLEGQDFELECDYVIPAVSQDPDLSLLPKEWNIDLTSWGTIKTDGKTFATNRRGVFSAGDCEYGPMTIVNAVGQARRAANVMLNYLKTGEIRRSDDETMEDLLRGFRVFNKEEKPTGYLGGFARQTARKLETQIRKRNHDEVNFGLTNAAALKEADRCMRCYYIALAALNG